LELETEDKLKEQLGFLPGRFDGFVESLLKRRRLKPRWQKLLKVMDNAPAPFQCSTPLKTV
jgi:hypothetical protein